MVTWKGLRVNKQLRESIKTVPQGECPKITSSNLVSLKSVRSLLALLVARDFLMDTNGNGMWAHLNTQWECACDFSRGGLRCTLGHGGNRRDQGFASKEDMCGLVETHRTFLCIPSAPFNQLFQSRFFFVSLIAKMSYRNTPQIVGTGKHW